MEAECAAVLDAARDRADRYLETLGGLPREEAAQLPAEVGVWVEEYESNKQAHADLLRLMGR